ncbi:hypothetical protein MAR_031395 [Mya arenaria]|uniref:Uncharacterized protein n=1 Tax=Mya arenaria TaxID=6604 RepID=A0ABY7F712_MYAAR|nr:hypothetical protein MAR_031395 [Mya arenaria]
MGFSAHISVVMFSSLLHGNHGNASVEHPHNELGLLHTTNMPYEVAEKIPFGSIQRKFISSLTTRTEKAAMKVDQWSTSLEKGLTLRKPPMPGSTGHFPFPMELVLLKSSPLINVHQEHSFSAIQTHRDP